MSDDSPLYELRQFARDVVAEHHDDDPHTLALRLVRKVRGNAHWRNALLHYGATQLLRESLRLVRMDTRRKAGPSWKSEVSRADFLSQEYWVGNKGWLPLGQCTRDDVLFIAHAYYERAAQNLTLAREFEALAEAMTQSGAATVADQYRDEGQAA